MRSRVDRSGCPVMMVPQVARIGFLFRMSNPVLQAQWKEAELADLPVEPGKVYRVGRTEF